MAALSITHSAMLKRIFCFLLVSLLTTSVSAGNKLTQSLRTVSLAPHITELIYAAGGGDTLVAVSAYSDYPKQATEKPVIGDAFRIDLERMITLQPDLVFYWQGTTSQQVLQQLKQHGFTAVPIKIESLSDIGQALLTIANRLQRPQPDSYHEFMRQLHIRQQQDMKTRTVFIQLSEQPLYTVDATHWMSEAAGLCGLQNVFQDLMTTAATVSREAVIGHNPEVIVRMQAMTKDSPLQQWQQIEAIKNQHIAVVNPDLFSRPTPRIVDAVDSLCQQVNQFSVTAGE